jgi:ParB-like chromosome segregation protein Spo0J
VNAIQSTITRLPLDAITVDDELQPRAKMDKPTWQEYGEALTAGATLPPVLVIAEPGSPSKLWLADGYHRLFAHQAVGAVEIDAEVRRGTREDALRLSLAANATHGKKRTLGDFKRGYAIAVRNALVEPDDSVGLMELLRCSIRSAEDLTEEARKLAVAKRNAEIIAAIDADETQAAVAARLGVSEATVQSIQKAESARRLAAEQAEPEQPQKTQTAETGDVPEAEEPPLLAYIAETVAVPPEPDDEPEQDAEHEPVSVAAAELPDEAARIRAGLAEIDSPEVRMWHDALEALRAVNRLRPPDVLFANRYRRFDHVFGPELQAAHARIRTIHTRFFNDAG